MSRFLAAVLILSGFVPVHARTAAAARVPGAPAPVAAPAGLAAPAPYWPAAVAELASLLEDPALAAALRDELNAPADSPRERLAYPDARRAAGLVRRLAAEPEALRDPRVRALLLTHVGAPALRRLEGPAPVAAPAPVGTAERIQRVARRWLKAEPEALPLGGELRDAVAPVVRAAPGAYGLARPGLAASPDAPRRPRRASLRSRLLAPVFAAMTALGVVSAPAPSLAQDPPTVQRGAAARDYARVRDIEGLLETSRADQHLYVVGRSGLDDGALRRIEGALAGTHWTVVIVEDASGDRYVDVDGIVRRDADAWEYASGQGLARKGWFAGQRHPQTGQPDGKVLTLVLGQRALLYVGSEAQDDRQLGDAQFKGNLDRWAIANMRSGGNIEGAILETAENIDALLARAVQAEVEGARSSVASAEQQVEALERSLAHFNRAHPGHPGGLGRTDAAALRAKAAAARRALESDRHAEASRLAGDASSAAGAAVSAMQDYQTAHAGATDALALAAGAVESLSQEAEGFRRTHPGASGDLANPPLEGWQAELAAARRSLAGGAPAEARSKAQEVREAAAQSLAALRGHGTASGSLSELARDLAKQKARERASEARVELGNAEKALADARREHERGDSGYLPRLESARSSLAAAEKAIDAADSSAAAWRLFWIFLSLLLSGGLAVFLIVLNRRVRAPRARAEELLQTWKATVEGKLSGLLGGMDDDESAGRSMDDEISRVIGDGHGAKAKSWQGVTQAKAAQIREDAGRLHLYWPLLHKVVERAEKLVRPKGWAKLKSAFSPKAYREAEVLLGDTPIEWKGEDGLEDELKELFKGKRTWKDNLLGKPSDFGPFKMSFQEVVADFEARAARVVANLESVEKAVEEGLPRMEAMERLIADAESKKAAVEAAGAADGLFKLEALFGSLLPSAREALAATEKAFGGDPVGALAKTGAEAERKAAEALRLADHVLDARSGSLARAAASRRELEALGIGTGWLGKRLAALSGRAEALALSGLSGSIEADGGFQGFKDSLSALEADAAAALSAEKTVRGTALPRIEELESGVAQTRGELGGALGLPEGDILDEGDPYPDNEVAEDFNPSTRLEQSRGKLAEARELLGQGELKKADEAIAAAGALATQAADILESTRRAFQAHKAAHAARLAETVRLEGLVPAAEAALERVREAYAASVLALGAGDAAHPNSNGTVDDNLQEAAEHFEKAKAKSKLAAKVHAEGRILYAADLLRQVEGHQAFIAHRLQELHEKEARLSAAVEANRAEREVLQGRVGGQKKDILADSRAMQPTLAKAAQAAQAVAAAGKAVDQEKGDPFQAAARLAEARALLDLADNMARNDRDLHAEAVRSLKAADKQLDAAQAQADAAKRDGHGDSPETVRAYEEVARLRAELRAAEKLQHAEHGDWNELDKEADRIAAAGAKAAATLKNEMAEAERTSSAISGASSKVREASSWTGSYGVTIYGSPGSTELSRARSLLEQGRYDEARRAADAAKSAAASAISDAEAEVSRKRRDEERRRANERREREEEEARRRRSSSGSSWSGGGGGGSSWGSSSSGSGRSSWGGSSSGAGRSGW